MGIARTKGAVWAWLVVIGCIGFYSIPTGIIGNTSGIFVAPVMDQFGWTQTDTTMYRTIQPLVAAVCAPIAGKLMEKHNKLLFRRIFIFKISSSLKPSSRVTKEFRIIFPSTTITTRSFFSSTLESWMNFNFD